MFIFFAIVIGILICLIGDILGIYFTNEKWTSSAQTGEKVYWSGKWYVVNVVSGDDWF